MALINCPECNKQVSDQAAICPNCSYPLNSNLSSTAQRVNVENVQFTKKKHKKAMILAAFMGIVGFLLVLNEATMAIGLIVLAVAIIYSVVIKLRVWWDHD